jgi:hypothetical protein
MAAAREQRRRRGVGGGSGAAKHLALLCFEVGRHRQREPQPLSEELLRGKLALMETEAFAAGFLQELTLLHDQAAKGTVSPPVRAAVFGCGEVSAADMAGDDLRV